MHEESISQIKLLNFSQIIQQETGMKKFFYPKSMAITGVSLNKITLGKIVLVNNQNIGFTGNLYGIGNKEGEVSGLKVYKDIASLPEIPDVLIILTPADTVPAMMEEAGKKGITHVVIESGGFSEYSGDKHSMEEQVLSTASRYGIKVIGPNCIGTVNCEINMMMPFAFLKFKLINGTASIVSQSGGVGDTFMRMTRENHIFFNKFVSVGNKLQLDEVDFLEYLIDDPKTDLILMYLEGFSRGRKFFDLCMKSEKPTIVMKSNRSTTSAKIAKSHTSALSANDDIVDSAFAQAAVVRIEGEDELAIATKAFQLPVMKGNRVAVLSRSGGHAVITADACARFGFDMIEFPESFISSIKSMYQSKVIAHQNPLDLGEIFDYTIFTKILEEAMKLDNVDGIIFNHLYQSGYESETSRSFLNSVDEMVKKYNKPVAVTLISDAEELLDIMKNHPFPTFTAPLQAVSALKILLDYRNRKEARKLRGKPESFAIDKILIDKIRTDCVEEKRIPLTDEALEICNAAGIIPVPYITVQPDADLKKISIGFPAAVKLLSKDASHKSDIGGVRIGLNNITETEAAIIEIKEKIKSLENPPEVNGFLIQEMAGRGEEFFVGGIRDESFGPAVMVGYGGIYIELFRDRAIRLAPVTKNDAASMLRELKTYPLLKGIRGRGPLDEDALIDIICRVSSLMAEIDFINEIDLNPVIVHEKGKGVSIVDSRIFFR